MTLTVTDLFCGGGGSSTGMKAVAGVEIAHASNHWSLAVEVHNQNHPETDHSSVDLHEEDPRYFPKTDILWASPECTKWSQASGGKYSHIGTDGTDLLSLLHPELIDEDPEVAIVQRSRLLMFDVLRFAAHHQYRAMVVENVVDIATNAKYRDAWTLWRQQLGVLGYEHRVVSFNSMHASAHGDPAPQSRDRLYIVCWRKGDRAPDIDSVLRPPAWCSRCGQVVESEQVWKNGRTVGKYRSQYVYAHGACGTTVEPAYLPAMAAIDMSLRGVQIGQRTKPLADKTRRRIAAGIARYWGPMHIEAGGNQYDAADPKHVRYGDPAAYYRAWPMTDPIRTLHTAESKALVLPLEGRAGDRCSTAADTLRTQTARHQDGFVTRAEWGGQDWSMAEPSPTVTTYDNASVISPPLITPAGGTWNDDARPANEAHRTMTTRETSAIVQPPFIAELRGGGSDARSATDPMSTVTASGNHHALVQRHNTGGGEMLTPVSEYLRTLTTTGHQSLLMPYYGSSKAALPVTRPIGTLTTVDRYALVQPPERRSVTEADIKAAEALVDEAFFRMLEPSEVALGMAFPADYKWAGTRRQRVKLAGNAVTPPAARDLLHPVAAALGAAA
ncbi:MAG: DNA cytosine methyltransferase [Nocardioides sp.]|uniref:DNA cytosine methyltransferase n=1 Tax=Nocardioides sp. TaxID=35761 RepID=UPI003F0B46D5